MDYISLSINQAKERYYEQDCRLLGVSRYFPCDICIIKGAFSGFYMMATLGFEELKSYFQSRILYIWDHNRQPIPGKMIFV